MYPPIVREGRKMVDLGVVVGILRGLGLSSTEEDEDAECDGDGSLEVQCSNFLFSVEDTCECNSWEDSSSDSASRSSYAVKLTLSFSLQVTSGSA